MTDGERRSFRSFFTALLRAEGIEPGSRSIPRGLALAIAQVVQFLWTRLRLRLRPPLTPIMVQLLGTEFSLSDQKARAQLGYRPVISIEQGLQQLGIIRFSQKILK